MTDRPAFDKAAYRFDLPADQIARRPAAERDQSRLLMLTADDDRPRHGTFRDVLELLRPGDCLVVNDTRVMGARLFAEKGGTGGKVEVLLCRPEADGTTVCLLNPGKKVREGTRLVVGAQVRAGYADPLFGTVLGRQPGEPGAYRVRFEGDVFAYAQTFGDLPLPPYLERPADDKDAETYQTVYAHPDKVGAAAAPTAGLHFTHALLEELSHRGVHRATVTLHVGPGTFLPVRTDDIREHVVHPERYLVDDTAAATLNATRAAGGRIVAVGTTSVRVLETIVDDQGRFAAGQGLTDAYIYPGYTFRAVDALITNFHLPESSLLLLVCAFAGTERVLAAYQEAVDAGYRFYSYGDASFLEPRAEDRP